MAAHEDPEKFAGFLLIPGQDKRDFWGSVFKIVYDKTLEAIAEEAQKDIFEQFMHGPFAD